MDIDHINLLSRELNKHSTRWMDMDVSDNPQSQQ